MLFSCSGLSFSLIFPTNGIDRKREDEADEDERDREAEEGGKVTKVARTGMILEEEDEEEEKDEEVRGTTSGS